MQIPAIVQQLRLLFDVSRFRNWLAYGTVIGFMAGLGAIVFTWGIDLVSEFAMGTLASYDMPKPGFEGNGFPESIEPLRHWLFLIVPAAGGLVVGWLVYTFAPETEGHGTDEVIRSFHREGGDIRARVPVVKTLASIITIGTGGSAGREGPVALIGAGIGSFFANLLKFPPKYRRLMIIAGTGGGIGSIFRAPLGGAVFATEVMYRDPDFEYEGLMPAIIAAIVGYSTYGVVYGWGATFDTPEFLFHEPSHLLLYLVLGVIEAGFGLLFIRSFYFMRERVFRKLEIKRHYKPAIGGLLLGILAFYYPPVLGSSYGWVQMAIYGKVALWAMILFPFLKILSTNLTIGSGGSGGVFAPSLAIGGMVGGAFGQICALLLPEWDIQPAAFLMVGMGGFFAGIAKVPLSSLILVAELTGSYGLLVPTMLVGAISLFVTRGESIYEAQVPHRGESPAHRGEFLTGILKSVTVDKLMVQMYKRQMIHEHTPLKNMLKTVTSTTYDYYYIINEKNRITGVIPFEEMRQVIMEPHLGMMLLAKDIAHENVPAILTGQNLSDAIDIFNEYGFDEIPVFPSAGEPPVGRLRKKDLLLATSDELGKKAKTQKK